MAQANDQPAGGPRGGAEEDEAQSLLSGETADNEGFHAGRRSPEDSGPEDSEPETGPGRQGSDPATGGPRDPTNAEQNPAGQDDSDQDDTGQDDAGQNPPLPRTWN